MKPQRQELGFGIRSGLVLLFTVLIPYIVLADVDVFNYRGHGEDQKVILQWETGNELDISGFLILRSNSQSGNYSTISPFIPGQYDLAGGPYIYTDTNVVNGVGYWYRLDGIDNTGITSEYGPIQVIAGVFATSTSTATPTRTRSSSNSTPTPTRTRTRTPTRTSPVTFFTSTPIFQASPTNRVSNPVLQNTRLPGVTQPVNIPGDFEISQTVTATATLLPLPELTIVFPTQPAVSNIERASGVAADPPEKPGGSIAQTFSKLAILAFIVLIWVFLGGWFYFSYRRLK